VRLRVDRAIRLGPDEVEPSDMAVCDHGRLSEPGRAEAVRVNGRVDIRSALAIRRILVGHHHLAGRPYRGVAVVAVAGPGNVLGRAEASELAEPGHWCPECLNLVSGGAREADPNAVRPDRDRRLVAELGLEVRNLRERATAVGGERDEDVAVGVDEVRHPEVSEAVPGELLIAADLPERVAGRADYSSRPRLAGVEGHAHCQPS